MRATVPKLLYLIDSPWVRGVGPWVDLTNTWPYSENVLNLPSIHSRGVNRIHVNLIP